MRLVVATGPGELELQYMWLPTWLGMSPQVKARIEEALRPELEGQPLTDELLDRAHTRVLDLLEAEFPTFTGLRAHLDSIRLVELAEAR